MKSSPTVLDPLDPDLCPETFRLLRPGGPFSATDERLSLVRVEELAEFARLANLEPAELRALSDSALSAEASQSDGTVDLESAFGIRAQNAEIRPAFVGFFDEVADLFGSTAEEDEPNWPEALRDRLGLAHLDPGERLGEIEILVFRYPVGVVARFRDREEKALVAPTVLDGRFSPAFLPPPAGSPTGHTVVLAGDPGTACRELLHPTIDFGVEHLFRVGTVRRPVGWGRLPAARGLQILECRERSGRDDYAAETDGDLLG